MHALLKRNADALWAEATNPDAPKEKRLGWMERKGLEKNKARIYSLFEKHFGPAYDELSAMKGGQAQ